VSVVNFSLSKWKTFKVGELRLEPLHSAESTQSRAVTKDVTPEILHPAPTQRLQLLLPSTHHLVTHASELGFVCVCVCVLSLSRADRLTKFHIVMLMTFNWEFSLMVNFQFQFLERKNTSLEPHMHREFPSNDFLYLKFEARRGC
jgi:hypothetical protein